MAHNLVTQVSQDFDKNKKEIAKPVVKKRNSVTEEKEKAKKSAYALLPPLAKDDEGKKTLVLDLDETLVHSSFKPIANPDFVISIELDGDIHQVYILKRPGVDDFLKEVGKKFEVVIFTASLSKYADPLLDKLDIHKAIKYRLFREHCVQHYGSYVKDLSKLGRELRNCMIVDNSPYSYIFQPEYAIPITSWFNDKTDTELAQLLPILDQTTTTDDVTKVLSLHYVVEK